MRTLDVETLVFLQALAGVVLTLMLLVVGRLLRGEAGVRPWGFGVACLAEGNLAFLIAEAMPFASLLAVSLHALGIGALWLGTRDYCGRPRAFWAVAAAMFAVAAAWLLFEGSLALRICTFGWAAGAAFTFLRHPPVRQVAGTRAAAGLFSLHALFELARIFLLPDSEQTRGVVAMESTLFLVALSFALTGLASQRLVGKLRAAARTDSLTGLLDRRAFFEEATRALEFCRRSGRDAALLVADLDHFKRLNDTRGHEAGDMALRHFGAEASRAASKGMLLGRLGGEEFCLLLPGTDAATAFGWADALRSTLEARTGFTVSFGLVAASDGGYDLDGMMERADEALYRAKAEGRNCVCLWGDEASLPDVARGRRACSAHPRAGDPLLRSRRRSGIRDSPR